MKQITYIPDTKMYQKGDMHYTSDFVVEVMLKEGHHF